jgi:hypothetical protein
MEIYSRTGRHHKDVTRARQICERAPHRQTRIGERRFRRNPKTPGEYLLLETSAILFHKNVI